MDERIRKALQAKIAGTNHPGEMAVHVMYRLQMKYGYSSDQTLMEAAALLDMTPLELEEIATFYDFIYREPVGRYVIHVCDGLVCWMLGEQRIIDYLSQTLGIEIGGTTSDKMFTLLPTACIGFCDHAPSMLINGVHYGSLTPERIDEVLNKLRTEPREPKICR